MSQRTFHKAGSQFSCSRVSLTSLSGEELTLEDTYHLQSLMQKLKMIEKRQGTLQEYVDADVKKVSLRCARQLCYLIQWGPISALHMACT